jgi:hypothetical protein
VNFNLHAIKWGIVTICGNSKMLKFQASMCNIVGKEPLWHRCGKGNEYAYDQLNAYQHSIV